MLLEGKAWLDQAMFFNVYIFLHIIKYIVQSYYFKI